MGSRRLLLPLAILIACAVSPAWGADPSSQGAILGGEAALPDGPGKERILAACSSCHGLDRITTRRKDAEGWHANVNDMVRLGAQLSEAEIAPVVAYLTDHFGPDVPIAASSTASKSRDDAGPQLWIVGSLERLRQKPVPETGRLSDLLPDREGKGLVLGSCVQCHGLRYTVQQRKIASEWEHTVTDMVSRGAQITKAEAALITRYLAENLAPDSE